MDLLTKHSYAGLLLVQRIYHFVLKLSMRELDINLRSSHPKIEEEIHLYNYFQKCFDKELYQY
jgi:hypothetical protein